MRFVGATSKDESVFRPDFLARFKKRVRLPPLRERREDIALLVRHFLVRRAQRDEGFSRYVVWMVAVKECKLLAAQLFADTVARHGVDPGLTVHSDRGSAMKSDTLAQLLATLGVDQSFSRPHVSDDNAFSEAQFKTLKYQPDYPGAFSGLLHARGWLEPFFGWHNDAHQHSGLALFTPAEVFFGRVADVHAVRQDALDAAYVMHPHRFPNGPPKAALPPAGVHINPLEVLAVHVDEPAAPTRSQMAAHAAPQAARREQQSNPSTAALPS